VKRPRRYSTVPRDAPPPQPKKPPAPRPRLPGHAPKPIRTGRAPKPRRPSTAPPASTVARIIDRSDASLLDVIDNLLNQGVVLNAELVLALANVDLVFLRLSALLCAADRVFPPEDRAKPSRRR
jgi:hypothetical protein